MSHIVFNEEAITALRYWRFQHPDPRVQVRMEALYLRSQGVANAEILRLCGSSKASCHRYLKAYVVGGVEPLKRLEPYRPHSELTNHRSTLEAYFQQPPPATVAEAAAKIAELTGLVRKPTQVRQYLRALGMKPMTVGMLPAKADVDAPEAVKNKPGPQVRGSWGGPARRLFHGCGPRCVRALLRHGLVCPTAVCQSALWAATSACVSGPECDHPRGLDGPESAVHDRGDGV
jgi:transposase